MALEFSDRVQRDQRSATNLVPNMREIAQLRSAQPVLHQTSAEQRLSGDVFPDTSIARERVEVPDNDRPAPSRHPFHRVLAHIEQSVYRMHDALKAVGKSGNKTGADSGQQHPCPFVSVAQKVGFAPKGSSPHGGGGDAST